METLFLSLVREYYKLERKRPQPFENLDNPVKELDWLLERSEVLGRQLEILKQISSVSQ